MTDVFQYLHNACINGDIQLLHSALESPNFDVNIRGDDGNTLLHHASAYGNENVVRLLIMRGASLDMQNEYGWTALMQACLYSQSEIVAALLQSIASVNVVNRLGCSALFYAVFTGKKNIVQLLLDAGADVSHATKQESGAVTSLIAAALRGHLSIIKLLLSYIDSDTSQIILNHQDSYNGWTALMIASVLGYLDIVKELVNAGADVNIVDICNRNALDLANLSKHRKIKNFLENKTVSRHYSIEEQNIIAVCKRGDLKRVREILDESPEQMLAVNPDDGATALMYAAMYGHIDIVRLLVTKGAQLDRQDTVSGWTALMQAAYYGHLDVVKYLLNSGVDVSIAAHNGCTTFDIVSLIENADTELVRILAAHSMKNNRLKNVSNSDYGGSQTLVSSTDQSTLVSQSHSIQKGKVKEWLSKISTRFKNLKIGRNFKVSDNVSAMRSSSQNFDSLSHSTARRVKQGGWISSEDQLEVSNTVKSSSLQDLYHTSLYTMNLESNPLNAEDEKLRPVIPPFLPQPTFELNNNHIYRTLRFSQDSSRIASPRFQADHRQTSLSNFKCQKPIKKYPPKFLYPTKSPIGNGTINRQSPFHSPQSSYESSTFKRAFSSHRASLLNSSGFGSINDAPESGFSTPDKSSSNSYHRKHSNSTSADKISYCDSLNSKRPLSAAPSIKQWLDSSTTSTDSSSDIPKNTSNSSGIGEEPLEDLPEILRRLSLEKYRPIFEEQEVDMEVFLTLTDNDLEELGISNIASRRQILTAIAQLNQGRLP